MNEDAHRAVMSDAHNAAVGAALTALTKPILEAGGAGIDLVVATESLVVGVALLVIKLGGDEAVLDVMLQGARARLAELRLSDIETRGTA